MQYVFESLDESTGTFEMVDLFFLLGKDYLKEV